MFSDISGDFSSLLFETATFVYRKSDKKACRIYGKSDKKRGKIYGKSDKLLRMLKIFSIFAS